MNQEKKVGWKDSKELCSILSNIRKQIAEANGIEYVQTECTHTGPCWGTCPACEQELQELERKLEEKKSRGEHVIIDCVSLFNEELLSFGNENLEAMNTEDILLGAIAGDIIGSVYEFSPVKDWDFPLFTEASKFTDDTVMTVANADWLLTGDSLLGIMQDYGNRYPLAGYGSSFIRWLWADDPQPYNSWGNGSAMRVSPVGWAFDTLEETLVAARRSAEVTHNHPEGIKGAQATAACVFLARTGKSKQEIKKYVEEMFGYNLSRTCNEIRPTYSYDISCQGTVPEAIIAFLESTDYESAIRLTISLRGDADTMGAITGGIAEAYYGGVPAFIKEEVLKRLPDEFVTVMRDFSNEKVKI